MAGNREYKSDVFGMLMEEPGYALEVYNALNQSDYRDPGLVEVCSLERGISLSVRNDAAFILDMNLSVYEHESTICPNMPLRALIYVTNILEQWVKKRNIYGRKLVKIPTPRFAVFYNGVEEQPEQYQLKLSDAYANRMEEPELELTCTVYNINSGKNRELLSECPVLEQYMVFVRYVREGLEMHPKKDLAKAIDGAIDRCIEEGVLREFLMKRREEVTKVTQLDYTFDRRIELEREDAREEALAEERVNTERERQAKEEERQRAEQAEKEVQRLRAELEQYKRQLSEARNQVSWKQY
ncbi:MAG: hypothetical protein HFH97_14550 [Lachnospiraceae bacterium]|jgi:hypothetical protein|nr:hypothetical protein [uncultured Acetatifactor sp.]MCI9232375.1 hypothetical protein [Lachnospiraceae bacterium]MCI9573801.1 hypothetical protein [Lachnospiraceae bacterium]